MKNLTANYTIKNLNNLIGNESLIQKKIGDPNRKGLYFQPTKNSLTVIFRFKKEGKTFQMKIGSYPSMPLQNIYSEFNELRQKLDNDINPIEEKKAEEKAKRLTELTNKHSLNYVFEDFYQRYLEVSRKHPTRAMDTYNTHVRNKLGEMQFDEITLIECRDLIDSLSGKRTPTVVYELLKQCWVYQHGRGFLEPTATNPFLILQKPIAPRNVRNRLITDSEMNVLWEKLSKLKNKKGLNRMQIKYAQQIELGAKLLVHTACRVGELNNNSWENIDFQSKTLTIPRYLDKEDTPRLKPLSDQSMELLEQLRFLTGNQEKLLGFDRQVIGRRISRISKENALYDPEGRNFHAHDLRTYFSTNARKIGLDRTIIESYLSHVTEKGASANYAFYDYQDEKRELACKWSNHVDSVVS